MFTGGTSAVTKLGFVVSCFSMFCFLVRLLYKNPKTSAKKTISNPRTMPIPIPIPTLTSEEQSHDNSSETDDEIRYDNYHVYKIHVRHILLSQCVSVFSPEDSDK